MKKLLLASTALVMMGGAAYAQEITFDATVGGEFGNWDGGTLSAGGSGVGMGGAASAWSWTATLTATLEGSAGGLTYGGSVTVDADENTTAGAEADFGEMWIAGAWGRLGFDENDYSELSSDDPVVGNGTIDIGDLKYTGSFGGVDVAVVLDTANNAYYFVSADYSGSGFEVGIESVNDVDDSNLTTVSASVDAGNFTFGGEAATDNSYEVFASTTFNGINAKVSFDDAQLTTINLDGMAGAVNWALELDSDSEYAASLGTSFGDTSIDVSVDSDANYAVDNEYDSSDAQALIKISHKVGKLELYAMANDNNDNAVGFEAGFDF